MVSGPRLLPAVGLAALCFSFLGCTVSFSDGQPEYAAALASSLLYFEGQRSGRLPPDQRVRWRGDSALADGGDHGRPHRRLLDAGDNVKFGFPMAFTVTMLSWGVVEYAGQLDAAGELRNALAAVRWGADYLARAHAGGEALYVQVGDGDADHSCWQRPEDMDTPRTRPGSDVAAETAAALAAAAPRSAGSTAGTARRSSCTPSSFSVSPVTAVACTTTACRRPPSSILAAATSDELLWAAAWLYVATGGEEYKTYIAGAGNGGGVRPAFSWDDKFVGAQALVTKLVLHRRLPDAGNHTVLRSNLEQFLCNVMQHGGGGGGDVKVSPGGMLWWQAWNNLQYVTAAAFVLAAHGDHLAAAGASLQCGGASLPPQQLLAFARSQVDYILGANPRRTSYMVGHGESFPAQLHHRGASLPSIKSSPGKVTCKGGFAYMAKAAPNPNVIAGAIVGGPDANDWYNDTRQNYQQGEPSTVTVAPIVGVLARLLQK
ncbi:hypothetical protein ACP4OV_016519 [Aristida adscensionis]